jgi:hypothetical protein
MSDPRIYPQVSRWPDGREPRLIRDAPLPPLPPAASSQSPCHGLFVANIIVATLAFAALTVQVFNHNCLVALYYAENQGLACELVHQVRLLTW